MPITQDYPDLVPVQRGYDERRAPGIGRPSVLNDPEQLDLVARAMADGHTTQNMADMFHVTDRTIRLWKKDPRVKSAALKFVEDRILTVTRKTDSKLDELLRSDRFAELAVKDQFKLLLTMRKEMLGGVLRMQAESGKVDASDINSALDAMESDPGFAEELQQLMERAPK